MMPKSDPFAKRLKHNRCTAAGCSMVKLEYLDDADFDAYLKAGIENYANEKIAAGTWTKEGSLEKARAAYARLLPDGRKTKDQHLFSIIDEATSQKVGIVWLGVNLHSEDVSGAFIWDIIVFPEFRGRGYGKGAMIALDAKARELGESKITLHVFGHNTTAIQLYGKVGYTATDLIMSKDL